MYMKDFEYNGERLSDYNLTICSFDGGNDALAIGNDVSINKIKAPDSYKYMSVGSSYTDAFTTTFQVCKFSCDDSVEMLIGEDELNAMVRWLNRKGFYKFKPIYDDFSFGDVYYNAAFNIQLLKAGSNVVGLELTLNTDSPFGYMESKTYSSELSSESDVLSIFDHSDEIGHLYCDATIKCLGSGTLIIQNSLDTQNNVIIKNCVSGETINLYGELKIIESDKEHKTLYNDFNYKFVRICNTYKNNKNKITSSLPCEITITYSPIRKVGIIV